MEQEGRTDEAVAIINRAVDSGINYIETAAAYGKGISEVHIGRVMKTRRKEVFPCHRDTRPKLPPFHAFP
ncbi:MAG: aldo/keto reductase [Bacteroidota bacterium]